MINKRVMIKRIVASIPNTITLLNLLSGAVACILSFHSSTLIGSLTGCQWAFIFIGMAAVFDFCDGASARLLHAYSPVGKELDSLADLVSFGLAPSLLLYNAISAAEGATDLLCLPALVSLFIATMGALRLARFNVDDRQTTEFIGLPIPANALFWIGYIAWMNSHAYPGLWVSLIFIVALGLMMVSPLHMFSLKFKNFAFKENYLRYLLIASAVLMVIWLGVPGFAWTIVIYILMSVVNR